MTVVASNKTSNSINPWVNVKQSKIDDLASQREEENVFQGFGEGKDPHKKENASWLSNAYKYLITQNDDLVSSSSKNLLDFLFEKLPMVSAKVAAYSNLFGAFLELTPIAKPFRMFSEKIITLITQLSFIPYGARGVINGLRKNNIIQAIAFLGEPIFAFMGNLKDIYLLRGAATGADQLPVATEKITEKKYGKVFPDMKTGVIEVCKALLQLGKEIVQDPIKTLFTLKPKGHMAFLSSMGDILSTIGYIFTGRETLFGNIRDISAFAFDWEMLLSEKDLERKAGILFIVEQFLDNFARRVPERLRLFTNMISHACGRIALQFYVESYNADLVKDKGQKNVPKAKKANNANGYGYGLKNLNSKPKVEDAKK